MAAIVQFQDDTEGLINALEQRVLDLERNLDTAQTRVAMLEFSVMNLQDELRKTKG